jgi:hypothetical protein
MGGMNLATQVPQEWIPLIAARAAESNPPLKPNTWITDIVNTRTLNPAPVAFVPRASAHTKQVRVIGFASGRTATAVYRRVEMAQTCVAHWVACVIGEALGLPSTHKLKDDDTDALNVERAEAARIAGLPRPTPLVKPPKPPKRPFMRMNLAALRDYVGELETRLVALEQSSAIRDMGKTGPTYVPPPAYGPYDDVGGCGQ